MAILVKDLIDAGVHFGHRASRWNPKMKPYIYGKRNLIHIIDLKETVRGLLRASRFFRRVAEQGGQVLFVGTKRQAADVIAWEADRCGMPHVTARWLGGTLTNFRTIRSRLGRLEELEQILDGEGARLHSKKMIATLTRERRKIDRNLSGIRHMTRLPEALLVVDPHREKIAVSEARKLGIKVVALMDTDCDPDLVDLPIPGNDDSMRSIELVLSRLADAVVEGKASAVAAEAPAAEAGAEQGGLGPRRVRQPRGLPSESFYYAYAARGRKDRPRATATAGPAGTEGVELESEVLGLPSDEGTPSTREHHSFSIERGGGPFDLGDDWDDADADDKSEETETEGVDGAEPPPPPPPAPPRVKRPLAWIDRPGTEGEPPLALNRRYVLKLQMGEPGRPTLVRGGAGDIPLDRIPPEGIITDWLVTSDSVELSPEPGDDSVIVSRDLVPADEPPGAGDAGAPPIGCVRAVWCARFRLLIPREEDSAVRRLGITPVDPDRASLGVVIFASAAEAGRAPLREPYSRFSIDLPLAPEGHDRGTPPC